MGEQDGWVQPSGLLPNGLLPNETVSVTRVLDNERWLMAEDQAAELITRIQPNPPSEERRNAVANYVQRLIMKCFSCQVFTFGSVPLKTYLPDGDIDLTAMSENENLKDTWAIKVRDILESEERSHNAEFHVKEVQYIQAEVKIIKCLVENIVVDISFNQVGGLCTLCFLEEIDHLINQNHLFKRSIILIKAWCYYESRILGAHHGLISTYALETLVLYIFHVFNNSFAGPLEVLYRFLEFFSNFDWANFCISLWGPIPIGSLPDMTAEPPRQDTGELLLNKLFLHACSTVYAVFPGGQESQGQPFISKYFNVVDPLRINNNLGRSVSKGNFFRIRSAFSFGAQRLASLLDCPKEDLIAGVNQFFTNTWERHGSGHRPDAPSPNLLKPLLLKSAPVEESTNTRSSSSIMKISENTGSEAGREHQSEGHLAVQGSSPQVYNSINQHSRNTPRTSNSSVASRNQSQRTHGIGMNSNGPVLVDMGQKSLPSDYSVSDHERQGRFQFARTQSSPELTETSTEILSRGIHSRVVETREKQNGSIMSEYGNRRNDLGSEILGGNRVRSADDPSSLRHGSSHQSLEPIVDSDSLSNNYLEDADSVSKSLEMHQEAQDLVNMMASSRLQNYNGPVQLPMHLASPHLPHPFSPVLASMGYTQRNLAGLVSPNISLFDPSWGSSMQFTQSFVSSPLSQYFPTASLNANPDDTAESGNGSSGMTEMNPKDEDHGICHEHDAGSTKGFQVDHGGFVSSSRGSNSVQSQHKFDRNTSLRFSQVSHAGSRSKTSWGNSRDGSSAKVSKPVREKWGAKVASSVTTSMYGKAKGGWQSEGSSDNVSAQEDDDRDWVPLSTMNTDMTERVTGSASLTSTHARSHQLSGYEPAQLSGTDSMVSIAPLLVGNSRPKAVDNPAVVPLTFYQTGPPVPFLTMLPFYNFPSDGSRSQVDSDEREDQSHVSLSHQNFDADVHMSSTTSLDAPVLTDVSKSDILNSDFASHWKNLQYGRICQNTQNHGPIVYPSPVMVPPVYLQGNFSWDGPGRPLSGNFISQMMGYGPRLVPVMPLQPGQSRPSGAFQYYGDETPRYRGGTGTFLPNPKAAYRDRQFSSTRTHRSSYNYDRNEHNDREGSWISAKARASGRSHVRNQTEKPNSRFDRSVSTDNRADRSWDSYRRGEPVAQREMRNRSPGSSHSSQGSTNPAYSMYPLPAVGSNGISPVVMLYSYDQGGGYGAPAEQLKFGSLGPVRLSRNDGNPARGVYDEQRHGAYTEGSPQTSPDHPSSPHIQRWTVERNYQLKDEDFPPLSFSIQEGSGDGNNYSNKPPRYHTFFDPSHS